ncbi:helix-turn-helix DNA binding domain protein [Arthrobacter phage Sarge]|uniref:Helix-turn-helix DNA binding domain protein n=1 Tax=Arthrobacter phage Sarge TaxID=2885974 RepID=A0AAE8Y5F5_9CAUD|nr:helix-turn-helix DNA binding domain protein [Arthrobacter phage Sarge]UDL14910.1 helix-turn-helix DNA binding domain protein [Arthrobacter phage Sarge]
MSQECTTADCANHTSTYLCGQCVSDLQQWLDKVPDLITELGDTIARLDNVRPAGGGWNSGGKPVSAAPLNLDALQMQENLRSVWADANAYAHDDRAAGLAWLIQDWVTKAELLVSGPEEIRIITRCQCGGNVTSTATPPTPTSINPDPADIGTCRSCGITVSTTRQEILKRIIDNAPGPMKTRDVVAWIKTNAGYNIATTDVRNWAREGLITRTNDPKDGHPTYEVQDVLRVTYRKIASGKGRKISA